MHNDRELMRDIFTEIFENQPADPMVSARRGSRPVLRKRFYEQASVVEEGTAFAVLLDGKPVKTPARRALAAPVRTLADAMAQEWNAQQEFIDPSKMPLTRLANVVIDAIAENPAPVADEVAKYLGSDLLCYRAEAPAALIALQAKAWDPVIEWARDELGARFVLIAGVVYAAQPGETIDVARKAIPTDPNSLKEIWRLGAVASITTLTGSGLLALALAHHRIDVDAAWAAAHVDEDWQMDYWGRDDVALDRRAIRFVDFAVAANVLKQIR